VEQLEQVELVLVMVQQVLRVEVVVEVETD
jgi:hypothetical protein